MAAAHTQSPLYYSNQNQYLLHGAALAGYGHLEHDWLANTKDPTPLFSMLVAGAYTLHPWLLQPAYIAMLIGYFLAVRWLVSALPGFPDTRAARITFAALFTATHAAILRWASIQLTGTDYPWYLQAGVAAQYVLGPGIQPSAFGILLLVAVAAFANGRPLLACALAALTCWFHSTYMLPAALLVLGFLFELYRQRRNQSALTGGALALGLVAPVVAYTVWQFDPFASNSAEALHVLADVRIPHHCAVGRWFDVVAEVQIAWVALALALLRGTPLARVLSVAGAGGVILTLHQFATDSDRLALAFPWRISVLLVPVATAVVAAKLLAWRPPGRLGEAASAGVLVALAAGGVAVTALGLGYRMVEEEEPLYDHVRASSGPGDVYLIPTSFPKVGSGRGAVSNTFKSPPRAAGGTNQIPVDLQRFRLATGAPIYVDFKSVPYAAPEVEEWYRRMEFAAALTDGKGWDSPETRAALKREGITHVVRPRSAPLEADYLEEVYPGEGYVVYRVK